MISDAADSPASRSTFNSAAQPPVAALVVVRQRQASGSNCPQPGGTGRVRERPAGGNVSPRALAGRCMDARHGVRPLNLRIFCGIALRASRAPNVGREGPAVGLRQWRASVCGGCGRLRALFEPIPINFSLCHFSREGLGRCPQIPASPANRDFLAPVSSTTRPANARSSSARPIRCRI